MHTHEEIQPLKRKDMVARLAGWGSNPDSGRFLVFSHNVFSIFYICVISDVFILFNYFLQRQLNNSLLLNNIENNKIVEYLIEAL